MPQIPDEALDELRTKIDIVDLVGRYVTLRRSGRNYKGLCPFHDEKTPSFNVNPSLRGFKCFGCGEGGDAIAFVMRLEGLDFVDAVRKLADLYGVRLPEDRGQRGSGASDKRRALALLDRAAAFYERMLWEEDFGNAARAYLERRGVSEATARAFRLGYAPAPSEAGWSPLAAHLAQAGLDLDLAKRLGLVVDKESGRGAYDRFRGRLVFPVVAPGGDVVAFSGRVLPVHVRPDDDRPPPKYVNSPESFVYRKGDHLYGLDTARKALRGRGRAVLVEGNFDVVRLHEVGIEEALAPLGTALTPQQAQRIARLTDRVVVCFDGDEAGRKATLSAIRTALEADLDVRVVLLPDGTDPADADPQWLRRRIEEAPAGLDWWMEDLAERAGTSPDARARALDAIVPVLCKLPRASARTLYAERASSIFGVPLADLRRLAKTHLAANSRRHPAPRHLPPSTRTGRVPPSTAVQPQRTPLPSPQLALVRLLLEAPHLANRADDLGASLLADDPLLGPVVRRIVEAARHGEPVDVAVLDACPPDERDRLERALYDGIDAGTDDPETALRDILAACEEARLERTLRDLETAERKARLQQDGERLRQILSARIATARRYDEVRSQRANGTWSPATTRHSSTSRLGP